MTARSATTSMPPADAPARFSLLGAGGHALRRAFALNAPLTIVALAMAPLALVALVGVVVDPRIITGAPGWLKPLKFALSTAIYCVTVLYLLTLVTGHARLVQLIGGLTAVGLAVELTLVPLQVVRGTTSHFNTSTSFDAAVYYTMGGFVALVYGMSLVLAVLLLVQRLTDPAWAWAVRFGVLGAVAGMSVALLMVLPAPAQALAMQTVAGHTSVVGGHTIGAADGGPGLPVVGWSTMHGDLRVPHFVGLHALQFMLALGWLLRLTRLTVAQRGGIVITSGLGVIGVTLALTWQALRGQALIAPDGATLGVMALLALLVAVGVASSMLLGRRGGRCSLPLGQTHCLGGGWE